jgi:pimeloyl-ACP methyl ester carboxylesterase
VPRAQALHGIDIGEGASVLVFHAYGVRARAYLPLARRLGRRVRVVIPDLFALAQWQELWTFQHVLDCVMFTLDDRGIERVTVIGHSFGGGLTLGLASQHPDRVNMCVFVDSLGPKRQLSLAREAARPIGLLRTASRSAALSFLWMWATHPVQLASAAVDGYLSRRGSDISVLRQTGLPCHVLWAADDAILSREDGEEFAHELKASFTVAEQPRSSDPLTHDWIIDQPDVFEVYIDKLGLLAPRRQQLNDHSADASEISDPAGPEGGRMEFDKETIVNFIKEHIGDNKADEANRELPDKVDTDKDAGLLDRFGVNPQDLLGKLGGVTNLFKK